MRENRVKYINYILSESKKRQHSNIYTIQSDIEIHETAAILQQQGVNTANPADTHIAQNSLHIIQEDSLTLLTFKQR